MALDPRQILDNLDRLQVMYFEDLAKNNDKFKALWASCSRHGHMFIFNFDSIAQKLLQQQNVSDVLDDMIITVLVAEWYLRQIGYPATGKISDQIKEYFPNTPPGWLYDKYQKQEILNRYISDTATIWFEKAKKLHILLGQEYHPKDLIEMARNFKEHEHTFKHVANSIL